MKPVDIAVTLCSMALVILITVFSLVLHTVFDYERVITSEPVGISDD